MLVRQRGVVGADEEIALGAIFLDFCFRVGDLGAQAHDLAGEPLAGGAGLVLFVGLLQRLIAFGDGVGSPRGKFRICRIELDRDDARFFHLEGGQPVEIALEHALLGVLRHRVLGDAEESEGDPKK